MAGFGCSDMIICHMADALADASPDPVIPKRERGIFAPASASCVLLSPHTTLSFRTLRGGGIFALTFAMRIRLSLHLIRRRRGRCPHRPDRCAFWLRTDGLFSLSRCSLLPMHWHYVSARNSHIARYPLRTVPFRPVPPPRSSCLRQRSAPSRFARRYSSFKAAYCWQGHQPLHDRKNVAGALRPARIFQ